MKFLILSIAVIIQQGTTTDIKPESTINVAQHCQQHGGSYLPGITPRYSICCYQNKWLYLDSKLGTSEILISYPKG